MTDQEHQDLCKAFSAVQARTIRTVDVIVNVTLVAAILAIVFVQFFK